MWRIPKKLDGHYVFCFGYDLMLLCNDCHNKIHGRVGKVGFDENGNTIKK